jgi:hypothetical protein
MGVVIEASHPSRGLRFWERTTLTCETVSVLSIFKNPVILMSLVSMGLFFGMPKLVEQSKFLAK